MLDYDETMRVGACEYRDVVDALRGAGLPAEFVQTGGMTAAIEAVLEGGQRLLVADDEDSLTWTRAEHRGWSVGLYPAGEGVDPILFDTTSDGDVGALLRLVDRVVRAGYGRRGRRTDGNPRP